MLRPSHSEADCPHSLSGDGCCCCNCRYRCLLEVGGFPMGYYCAHPMFDRTISFIGYSGHSMCELHQHACDADAAIN